MTGVQTCALPISLALVGAIAGEFVASQEGLGYVIITAQSMFQTVRVFASIVLLGVAGTRDEVRVFHRKEWEDKRSLDLIAGVTQLLDPRATVTLNLTWGRTTGYLADPYKLVQKNTEVIPGVFLPLTFAENRPADREKWIGFAGYNRAFPEAKGALELSGRLYHDSYDTNAFTFEAAWFQHLEIGRAHV